MRIGLVDVDGHNWPNLPLMKISACHKERGDTVVWWKWDRKTPAYDEQMTITGETAIDEYKRELMEYNSQFDKIYSSKVFDFTPENPFLPDWAIKGGTGYSKQTKLPAIIESAYPDYGLYGITDTAYGFLTRGCPRQCDFCIVSSKEGCQSYKVADLSQFWRGQKEIILLDANLLACRERVSLLEQLIDSRAQIDFTQGLDIRFMTEELTDMIMRCKIKMLHFAWDTEAESIFICRKLREFKRQTGIDCRKARVYILTNYDTSFEFDLYRVYELQNMGYDPYIMIYNKQTADKSYKRLQRWVNNKFIFRSCERFEDYRPEVG